MAWPTTSDPRTEFVTVRLTAAEAADLDALAAAAGQTRSEAVRNCIDVMVAKHKKAARKKAAQAAS